MNKLKSKPVEWIGTSLQDLREFPEKAQVKIGRSLQQVQYGGKPDAAKVLSGFHGAGVLELRADYDGDTYRAVYTIRLAGFVYVLHAFQKKSKQGIQTEKRDIDLIKSRLKLAEEMHRELVAGQEKEL